MTERIELTDEERKQLPLVPVYYPPDYDTDHAYEIVESIIASRVSAAKAETREQVAQEIEADGEFVPAEIARTAEGITGYIFAKKRSASIARGATQNGDSND